MSQTRKLGERGCFSSLDSGTALKNCMGHTMSLKYLKPAADIFIPLICWIYYIPGYLLFFAPVYLVSYVFSSKREMAWQQLNHLFFKIFFRLLQSVTPGLSLHVADEVFSIRSAVIVSNHVSYLDPILLISLYEKQKTIVKNIFFKLPVFGWILRTSGYIPSIVDANSDTIGRIEALGAYLASGGNLFIFPEGTRSRNGRLGRFNRSAFKIAVNCKAPICVLFIQNTDVLYPPGRFRFFTCVPNTIRIELIGRIETGSTSSSISELADQARTMMLQRCNPPKKGEK
ncbi:MAG: lysophospholipid acyltransferase family protein [Desulfobacterales bacterium]|nr:lysophospholipid acyltransferase family protein [Desulfobacterales bacterium]